MPFYDYKCNKCGKTFEVNRGMNDKTGQKCPECDSEARRVFNIPRTMRSGKGIFDPATSEQSGACSTCSSGVCSSCSTR